MKFTKLLLCVGVFVLGTIINPSFADEYTDTIDLFRKSSAVQPFWDNAYGFAVFPTVGKGGFVVGGAFGQGQVYRMSKNAAPIVTGTTNMLKASIGFQAGGQVFSEMIFFQDERAYNEFVSGNFEFGADASAVAITTGAQASAGSEGASAGASLGPATGKQAYADYHKGIVVFVHIKGGLMFEASVGGQKFSFEPVKK